MTLSSEFLKCNNKRIRTSLAAISFVMMGLVVYNIQQNPTDSAQKMIAMEKTASTLLSLGGNVVEKKQNAKYGSAVITILFDSKDWSPELVKKYENSLINDGWKLQGSGVFCRDSVELKIAPHSSEKNGQIFNFFGISYDAITIKDCERH